MSRSELVFIFGCFMLVFATCKSPESEGEAVPNEEPVAEVYEFTTSYLTGHFDPATHPDLIEIDTLHADRLGLFLRKEVYEAFLQMTAIAKAKGIQLVIRSATRNFDYQKGIWERKWTGETLIDGGKDATVAYPDSVERALAILKFSSMPGTSRHHWGTDIDLNSFENSWFENGEGQQIYAFLVEYGPAFGFCQPYSPKGPDRPDGYEEERWHWTYMPTANKLMNLAADSLQNAMISGFKGATTADEIDVVEKYVMGISEDCH